MSKTVRPDSFRTCEIPVFFNIKSIFLFVLLTIDLTMQVINGFLTICWATYTTESAKAKELYHSTIKRLYIICKLARNSFKQPPK